MTLRKLTLGHDRQKNDWALREDQTGRTLRRFETKEEATKGGVLEGILGKQGGSVKITTKKNVYQEERTYPRSKDPRRSPG